MKPPPPPNKIPGYATAPSDAFTSGEREDLPTGQKGVWAPGPAGRL